MKIFSSTWLKILSCGAIDKNLIWFCLPRGESHLSLAPVPYTLFLCAASLHLINIPASPFSRALRRRPSRRSNFSLPFYINILRYKHRPASVMQIRGEQGDAAAKNTSARREIKI